MVFEIIQGIDNQILFALQGTENPLLTAIMQGITLLGNPATWFVLGALIYWTGRENQSMHFLTVALFAMLATGILKIFFGRPRPSPEQFKRLFVDYHSSFSFPSGHATTIAAYFSFLGGRLSKASTTLFGFLVILVLLSRVYLGAHFVTDVIAGLLIGLIIGKIVHLFFSKLKAHHFQLTKLREETLFVGTIAGSLIALFFLEKIKILAIFFGFYAGFFLLKEMQFKQKKVGQKILAAKLGVGLMGLAVLAIPPYFEETLIEPKGAFILLFLAGFWTSFLFPFFFERVLNNRFQK